MAWDVPRDPETYQAEAYRAQVGGYYGGIGTYTPETTSTIYGDDPQSRL